MSRVKDFALLVKLAIGLVLGALAGLVAPSSVMEVVVSLRHIFSQIIFFLVPLIIIGFITPAIVRLGQRASKILGTAVAIAYVSSLGAALFAAFMGYTIIPWLSVPADIESLRALPPIVFQLDIPPLMSVMSALAFALLFGIAVAITRSKTLESVFIEMESVMRWLVTGIIIPILPFFVGLSFMCLAYGGALTSQLPVFFKMVLLVLAGHVIWLALLYGTGGIVSGRNPLMVLRYYPPVYLTAMGTMSSAATLPVALREVSKSPVLSKTMIEFMIPLGATVHLCGSVLTETFFCMTISMLLYGSLPPVGTMILFCVLLAIFAVGAPGVPGGTVVASLGVVTMVLGFDAEGVALLMAIFALQDSFGTACNVTGDGALTLIMEGLFNKKGELGPVGNAAGERL